MAVFNLILIAWFGSIASDKPTTIWYVSATADGLNTGHSWIDAFVELQSALAIAQAGDQIWVAKGTYRPDYDLGAKVHTADRAAFFELKSGVALYGGFAGDEFLLEHRAGEFDNTILSGDIGYPDFAEDNTYHVVKAINVDNTSTLDGFSIRGGRAPSVLFETCGGGMVLEASSPTITNCLFMDNHAHQFGGGICTWESQSLISKCRFVLNSAISEGGAIYNRESSPRLVDCLFQENNAMYGGAISNSASSPEILRSSFEKNEAYYQGGGLFNEEYSSPLITSCTFRENSAGAGGALAVWEIWPNRLLKNCSSAPGG